MTYGSLVLGAPWKGVASPAQPGLYLPSPLGNPHHTKPLVCPGPKVHLMQGSLHSQEVLGGGIPSISGEADSKSPSFEYALQLQLVAGLWPMGPWSALRP